MVKRAKIKKREHGAVVVGACPLLHAQIRINVAVKVSALKAPGILNEIID